MFTHTTRRPLGALLVLACALLPLTSHAQLITFQFSGVVDRSQSIDYSNELPGFGIFDGTEVSGNFTFESTTPDSTANTGRGTYNMDALSTFNMRIGTLTVAGNSPRIDVVPGANGTYEVNSTSTFTSGGYTFESFRLGVHGIPIVDDSLLLNAPDISPASLAFINLFDGVYTSFSDQWRVRVNLTSLTGGIDQQGNAPAPPTAILMLGLLGLLMRLRSLD